MKTNELDYELPPELIAQRPAANRDESRLLVAPRGGGEPRHRRFRDPPGGPPQGAPAVVNDTPGVPPRVRVEAPPGGGGPPPRPRGGGGGGGAPPPRRGC